MTGYGDRILATAESMRGIEAAIPGLVSTTNTLVDIGMTQIHQTAIFQRTLEEGLLARPDLDESEPDDATPGTDVVDATDSAAARLAPAERQILDNFARALQTFVS